MHIYVPPYRPTEGYTQGFWYAIAAAALYTACSMLLMVNMLGYFLGHYPESFALSDSQRTLILQSMAFFIWLAGGASVFSRIENDAGEDGWDFPDALYFCDVTILTVGFGDLAPTTDAGRGIVFPYSVGGIVMLALIVSSLHKAVQEMSKERIVQKHVNRMRRRVLERTVTNFDLRHREHTVHHLIRKCTPVHPDISTPADPRPYRTTIENSVYHGTTFPRTIAARKPKLMLLKEEKDRFNAMRQIQANTKKFKRWMSLLWSVSTFAVLWCVGAVVFWQAEKGSQGMSYFQALYFCYISLLTIGYGDLAPKSNAGRCFFVIWSLIAVPTMTILVSSLSDTVVAKFKMWSDELADFTVLPKRGVYICLNLQHGGCMTCTTNTGNMSGASDSRTSADQPSGIWRSFVERHPWLMDWLQRRIESHNTKKRLRKGFEVADLQQDSAANTSNSPDLRDDPEDLDVVLIEHPTISSLAQEAEQDSSLTPSHESLSRRLALSIQKVSMDFRLPRPKRYVTLFLQDH